MWYKTKSILKLGPFCVINTHIYTLGHSHAMNSCIYFLSAVKRIHNLSLLLACREQTKHLFLIPLDKKYVGEGAVALRLSLTIKLVCVSA